MNLTGIIVVTALILLVGYDITIAIYDGNQSRTISEFIWRASHIPVVSFGSGFLMGHFFWRVNDSN